MIVPWVMVAVAVAVNPLMSVTVTVYIPAMRPVAVCVVCTGVVFHEYVIGVAPPLGVTVALPVACPLQATFVCDVMLADKLPVALPIVAVGSVNVLLALRTLTQSTIVE